MHFVTAAELLHYFLCITHGPFKQIPIDALAHLVMELHHLWKTLSCSNCIASLLPAFETGITCMPATAGSSSACNKADQSNVVASLGQPPSLDRRALGKNAPQQLIVLR